MSAFSSMNWLRQIKLPVFSTFLLFLFLICLAFGGNKAMGTETCDGSDCPQQCMPRSLGFFVEVMQVLSPQRAKFCIQLRGRGNDWFVSEVWASGYPSSPVCACNQAHFTWVCGDCSNKCTVDLTSYGYSIDFWGKTTKLVPPGWGVCVCTTDPITIPIQPPDTSEQLPTL